MNEVKKVAKEAEKEQQAIGEVRIGGYGKLIDWYSSEQDLFALPVGTKIYLAPTTQQAAKAESEQAKYTIAESHAHGATMYELGYQNGLQAHVMPPMRGTDSQRDADERAFDALYIEVMNLRGKPGRAIAMHGASKQAYQEGHRNARHAAAELIAELASRGRAQGGNTSKENGSDLATPTTSTVSAPPRTVTNSDGSTSTYVTEYENDLENDLAAIRDMFPIPQGAGELHNLWSEACGQPHAVVAYVKAQVSTEGAQAAPKTDEASDSIHSHPIAAEAAPEDVRNQAQIEEMAKEIYGQYGLAGRYPWVEGGNSVRQDEAREEARRRLRTTSTDADTGSAE